MPRGRSISIGQSGHEIANGRGQEVVPQLVMVADFTSCSCIVSVDVNWVANRWSKESIVKSIWRWHLTCHEVLCLVVVYFRTSWVHGLVGGSVVRWCLRWYVGGRWWPSFIAAIKASPCRTNGRKKWVKMLHTKSASKVSMCKCVCVRVEGGKKAKGNNCSNVHMAGWTLMALMHTTSHGHVFWGR